MAKRKVLLYLGKFPGYGMDIDGGSILAYQLIDSLKTRCELDVVFIRKHHETFSDDDVHSIAYVEYLDAENNKFIRRLENLETNATALKNYRKYNLIITAHISKFFGMNSAGPEFWEKTILFPMFCTRSYVRAGEVVPCEYTSLEQEVFDHVAKVITPSFEEAIDLQNDYGCDLHKLIVIPRGITPLIKMRKPVPIHKPLQIVCIASIKPQKNNMGLVYLVEELQNRKTKVVVHFICTIYERGIYERICHIIKERHWENCFKFHIAISQKEVAQILLDMDINVSVSNWETFGRGILEGASAGLPTFVPERLSVIKRLCGDENGVFFSNSIKQMADQIMTVTSDPVEYMRLSIHLAELSKRFSYKLEQERLLNIFLGGDKNGEYQ